jgi:hypothetical protein
MAIVRATALAGAVLTAATPALAIEGGNRPPLEGHLAIMALPPFGDIPYVGSHDNALDLGAEAELGPRDGFWLVGVGAWTSLFVSAREIAWNQDVASTLWGRLRLPVGGGHELSVLAGGNYRYSLMACPGSCEPDTPYGLLLGASWQYRGDRWWLRVTPQYTFPLFGERQQEGWMLSTVPWAEIGYRLTPQLGISFRVAPAPFKLTLQF